MSNLGWLFYRDYFKDIDFNNIASQNDNTIDDIKIIIDDIKIINILDYKIHEQQDLTTLGNIHFKATTTYPGLLLGSGYLHELPDVKGQVILGFDFDYTTGLPIIRGSSIKGVLRSAFRHSEYIGSILNSDNVDVDILEKEIFESGRDIFFDAVIAKPNHDKKILGDDYITPHKDELKNPIPLRFVKVLPDVTFRFDFTLTDGTITKEQKSKLFQTILEDLGIGAKTNVGYGKLKSFKLYKTKEELEKEKQERQRKREQEEKEQKEAQRKQKEQKEQKAKEGLASLKQCKTLDEVFKILKDVFGAKPTPTNEQKEQIQAFCNQYKKRNKLSNRDKKTLKKYGVSI